MLPLFVNLPYIYVYVNVDGKSSMNKEVCGWRNLWTERMSDTNTFYKC